MCELSPVTFHGDTIFCLSHNDQPFTPVKPIVENMGMDWPTQFRKLKSNQERWGIVIMTIPTQTSIANIAIPSESGEQQTLCMPVRKLPAFLASINPKKVKPELREKIELYQRECDDALWDYWTKGKAERQPVAEHNQLPPVDAPLTPDQQCTLQAIVKARIEGIPEAERPKGLYPQVWSRFKNHFRVARYSQLPQTRMSEAVEYLTQMELMPKKALPPTRETAHGLIPVPRNASNQLRTLHSAQERCRWELLPQPYDLNDREAEKRFHLQEDLYKLQDCLWAALYNICSAAVNLRA